ncbi:MAG TPA: transcriptional regulator [Croceibacterium sp.]|jgi:DNA-binding winged helix-turn-helix (wHTH) protein
MPAGCFRFDAFVLDPGDRQLRCAEGVVELNARYFDALTLLVRERGRLVSKDRFHEEVWRGIPVTDEALTQCIRTLRRQLGDDAAQPRFIETVPKHGYRFIAEVSDGTGAPVGVAAVSLLDPWRQAVLLGAAGTVGAGVAGLLGGLVYGFVGASQPLAPGMGGASLLLVLVSISILIATIGGAGVAFGIAAARVVGPSCFATVAGGALGGLVVGALVKLLGLDAFSLLLGRSPGDITGAPEGLVLGAAVGLGAWLAIRIEKTGSLRRGVAVAAIVGAAAGAIVPLAGGRMFSGSLASLAQAFPGSRLRFDQFGHMLGEQGFGRFSQSLTGALEGLLFAAGIVGAMLLARRQVRESG